MKRKRISRNTAMAAVASTPVATYGVTTYDNRSGLAKYIEQYEREAAAAEQAKAEAEQARIQPLLDEQQELLKKLRSETAQSFYTMPSQELADAPKAPDNITDDVATIRAQVRDAFNEFRLQAEQQGVKFEQTGVEKLSKAVVQNPAIEWRKPESFQLLYQAMEDADCFSERDRTLPVGEQPQPEPAPVKPKALDLESMNTSTRSGQRAAKELCDAEYFTIEGRTMMKDWEAQIYRDYGVLLDDDQKVSVVNWIVKWNKNPLAHETWNAARRALGKAQVIPQMFTQDEILAERLEVSNLTNYEDRRAYAAESRRIIAGQQA